MSRLTELPDAPAPKKESVGPHQFRRLGDFVLASDDAGRFAFLSPGEYREYLRGLKPASALREKLAGAGLLGDAFDFDAAAQDSAERTLLSWPGPSEHVIRLQRYGGQELMDLETARAVVDFCFSTPGPVSLHIQAEPARRTWSVVWFIVQYARRKSEWQKRALSLSCSRVSAPTPEEAEFFAGHKVELRSVVVLGPSPERTKIPAWTRRVQALVEAPAKLAGAWIDKLAEGGVESVLLVPVGDPKSFLAFYESSLDRMLQLQGRLDIREERAQGLLSGRRWLLPGHDLLSELCYTPDGGIYSSELAARLSGEAKDMLKLGEVGKTRWEDFAKNPAVHAILAASLAETQPMCAQCAYRAFCAVPPSENLASQGTLWGRHPESSRCSLHMAILDILFSRMARTETAVAMRQWLS